MAFYTYGGNEVLDSQMSASALPIFDVYDGDEKVQIICAHDEEEARMFIVPEWYRSGWVIQARKKKKMIEFFARKGQYEIKEFRVWNGRLFAFSSKRWEDE